MRKRHLPRRRISKFQSNCIRNRDGSSNRKESSWSYVVVMFGTIITIDSEAGALATISVVGGRTSNVIATECLTMHTCGQPQTSFPVSAADLGMYIYFIRNVHGRHRSLAC